MRVQMLGLCRFSYLGMRGFQVEHDTIEERRAYLYDPARLERRWQWFTEFALPGWRAQTDPDFTLVVMTGPDLPEPWLSRLRKLCAEIPQLRLSLVPPMEFHLPACRQAVAPHLDPEAEVIGHFRHDDDDAVAIDYIEAARTDFAKIRELWRSEQRLSVDYGRGLMMRTGAEGAEFTPRICHNMGVALTVFLPPEAPETALHYDHSKLPRWMSGVSLNRTPMFIRSIHRDSDSGSVGPGQPWDHDPTGTNRLLRERFGLQRGRIDRLVRRMSQGS
ncbi:putative rhamnosyl transferase [Paracoccus sp. 1_MG-2023]|uniref:putative rhamnosyl transferase n=1 Tax=unclassified Paracoccus (in: a-proteobacteria) TaxID=2688777 RepID=UPI001C0A3630|nr:MULTISPECIES: putative rhamnosyl transferase [unclassified Paracoccus (in: a-proteobacteria)]MBU2957152.1 putative rhamnosyl transferase [Paracoccus sp. C2R09]MDO6669514.1 putative rhamnosyl transferase [Paracoccus sp. 1_MG-2023]